MNTIRIIIIDDHPVVREGLRGMLASQPDFEVVSEVSIFINISIMGPAGPWGDEGGWG